MLEEITSKEKVVGLNQSIKLIRANTCEMIYLAADADSRLSGRVEAICTEYAIPICGEYTSRQLGEVCGIDVGCAVVGIRMSAGGR